MKISLLSKNLHSTAGKRIISTVELYPLIGISELI